MKNIIITSLGLLTFCLNSLSQNKIQLLIEPYLSIPIIENQDNDQKIYQNKVVVGYGSSFLMKKDYRQVSMLTGVRLSSSGYRFDIDGLESSVNFIGISIPILIEYNFNNKLSVGIGSYISYNSNPSTTIQDILNENDTNKIDYSITTKSFRSISTPICLYFSKTYVNKNKRKYSFNVNFIKGINLIDNVKINSFIDNQNNSTSEFSFKNSSINLSFRYFIKKSS